MKRKTLTLPPRSGRILPSANVRLGGVAETRLTRSQAFALAWLRRRTGDACFDRHGVAFACGETAPVLRSTWNVLCDHGLLEFYNPAGKGHGRLRLTARGLLAEVIDEG